MDNISDDDLAKEDNSTNSTYLPDATSLTEYRAGVILWKVWVPCILLLGGFGNIATIIIMHRIKDHNSSQYAILMVLAMSDITLLYCAGVREWVRHMFYIDLRNLHALICKFHKWLLYGGCTTSAWLVTCVTVQRTMAVLWPHRMRTVWTVRRTWIVIAFIVIIAFGCQFHLMLGLQLSRDKRCDAAPGFYEYFYRKILMPMDMCLSSLFPSLCQFICDVILSVMLFKTSSGSSIAVHAISSVNNIHKSDSRRKTASRTTVTVLTLSCTFVILNLPMYVFYAIWYGDIDSHIKQAPEVLAKMKLVSAVTHLLGLVNCAVNFYLYCLTGSKYRQEFLNWILCRGRRAASVGPSCESRRGDKKDDSIYVSQWT